MILKDSCLGCLYGSVNLSSSYFSLDIDLYAILKLTVLHFYDYTLQKFPSASIGYIRSFGLIAVYESRHEIAVPYSIAKAVIALYLICGV